MGGTNHEVGEGEKFTRSSRGSCIRKRPKRKGKTRDGQTEESKGVSPLKPEQREAQCFEKRKPFHREAGDASGKRCCTGTQFLIDWNDRKK